jgi:hypothetical protein
MDLRERGWDCVDRMRLALDRDQWRVLVNTVMNPRVPRKAGEGISWLAEWLLSSEGLCSMEIVYKLVLETKTRYQMRSFWWWTFCNGVYIATRIILRHAIQHCTRLTGRPAALSSWTCLWVRLTYCKVVSFWTLQAPCQQVKSRRRRQASLYDTSGQHVYNKEERKQRHFAKVP